MPPAVAVCCNAGANSDKTAPYTAQCKEVAKAFDSCIILWVVVINLFVSINLGIT